MAAASTDFHGNPVAIEHDRNDVGVTKVSEQVLDRQVEAFEAGVDTRPGVAFARRQRLLIDRDDELWTACLRPAAEHERHQSVSSQKPLLEHRVFRAALDRFAPEQLIRAIGECLQKRQTVRRIETAAEVHHAIAADLAIEPGLRALPLQSAATIVGLDRAHLVGDCSTELGHQRGEGNGRQPVAMQNQLRSERGVDVAQGIGQHVEMSATDLGVAQRRAHRRHRRSHGGASVHAHRLLERAPRCLGNDLLGEHRRARVGQRVEPQHAVDLDRIEPVPQCGDIAQRAGHFVTVGRADIGSCDEQEDRLERHLARMARIAPIGLLEQRHVDTPFRRELR